MTLKEFVPIKHRNIIVKSITSNRKKQPIKSILKLAEHIVYAGKNVSYNSQTNGESNVVKKLAELNFNIIIDCGANVGSNSLMFKQNMPNATIYAIEAIDETLEICKENLKKFSDIHYFNIGLGSERTQTSFKYFPANDYLTTKYENLSGKEIKHKEKTVEIYTGDGFCEENNINHVNFVKIDVEGMDFEVIKGFDKMMTNNSVDVFQIEYSSNFVFSNSTLKNLYDYSLARGYIIGKVYPKGVEFLDYNVEMEDYSDANFLIVRKDLTDLIKILRE